MSNKYIKNNGNGNFKVTVPFEINTYNQWSVVTEIITPETFEDCTLINTLAFDNSEIKSFKLDITNTGALNLHISTDGSTYISSLSSRLLEPNNQAYFIKIIYNGEKYIVEVSTNNINWTQYIVIENSTALYANLVYVNFIPTIDSAYFKGKLNIVSTKLLKKDSEDLSLVEIFSGDTASAIGYINYGVNIDNNNIASGFNTTDYIVCNGIELTDYVQIITRININSIRDPEERVPVIVTPDKKGLYIYRGRFALYLTSTEYPDAISYSPGNAISLNKDYYVKYMFYSDNGVYTYRVSFLEDDGYYNDYTELPNNSLECVKPWYNTIYINHNVNIFKNLIYIGSDKTNYFDGTVDLNNTVISNNIVTYCLSRPDLQETASPNTRCYIPGVGTKILDSASETISNISLDQMVKFTINARDIDEHYPIDLSNASVWFTVTNNNYGSNPVSYYKRTTDKRTIYVLPGSDVTYSVYNVLVYDNASKTVSNVTTDTTDTIDLTCNRYYTFTVNAVRYTGSTYQDINSDCTFLITSGIFTSNTNTMQVKYGRPVSYEVYHNDYHITYRDSLESLSVNKTVSIKFDSMLYYTTVNENNVLEYHALNHIYMNPVDAKKTFISNKQYYNVNQGVYILNNELYYCAINSNGDLIKRQIPLNNATSETYASDWTALGTNCAIRGDKVYGLHNNRNASYARQINLPSENYVDASVEIAYGGDYCAALTDTGKLYYCINNTTNLITTNATKIYSTPSYNTGYYSYGYYVNDTGLRCYDTNLNDTLLNANTNWTVLVPCFGICDGKLYWINGTTISQVGTDTDWMDVGFGNNISYSSTNNNWNSSYVYAIKGGNVVKLQLSGTEVAPTPVITQFTPSGNYSKLSYGYKIANSTSSSSFSTSFVFVSKKNDSNNYELYNIPNTSTTLSPYTGLKDNYVIDMGGMTYAAYNKTSSTYVEGSGYVTILHLGTVEKL